MKKRMGDRAWLRALYGAMVIFAGFRRNRAPHPGRQALSPISTIEPGRRRLSSFRVYLRRFAAGYGFLVNLKSEKSLLQAKVTK
jgi:hypothetical protein